MKHNQDESEYRGPSAPRSSEGWMFWVGVASAVLLLVLTAVVAVEVRSDIGADSMVLEQRGDGDPKSG